MAFHLYFARLQVSALDLDETLFARHTKFCPAMWLSLSFVYFKDNFKEGPK
jgi:hypothetical protein